MTDQYLPIGTRVRLTQDVDRYPHFIAEKGRTGVVVEGAQDVFAVRMDDPLPGSEEWENEVQWFDDMHPARDVEVIISDEVAAATLQAKMEILEDMITGRVPKDAACFSDLHDHVDANEYGGLTTTHADLSTDDMIDVQEAVDEWLRERSESRPADRTILVHVNLTVTNFAPSAQVILQHIEGALEVGLEGADEVGILRINQVTGEEV